MAIPPEPIDEVLPEAECAVVAEITRVLSQGEQDVVPEVGEEDGIVDTPRVLPWQRIILHVKDVLFGDLAAKGDELEVLKPPGNYTLRADIEVPFLLAQDDEDIVIIGRYGPDTYSLNEIKAAAQKHNRT